MQPAVRGLFSKINGEKLFDKFKVFSIHDTSRIHPYPPPTCSVHLRFRRFSFLREFSGKFGLFSRYPLPLTVISRSYFLHPPHPPHTALFLFDAWKRHCTFSNYFPVSRSSYRNYALYCAQRPQTNEPTNNGYVYPKWFNRFMYVLLTRRTNDYTREAMVGVDELWIREETDGR